MADQKGLDRAATNEFFRRVDHLLLEVMLILKWDSGEEPQVRRNLLAQAELEHAIERADGHLTGRDDWRLARWAILAWIDDCVTAEPAPHRWQRQDQEWWRSHLLLGQLTPGDQSRAGSQFYQRAIEAAAQPTCAALLVFLMCVAMGFEGQYRDADPATRKQIERQQFRGDLSLWLRQLSENVKQQRSDAWGLAGEEGLLVRAPRMAAREFIAQGLICAALVFLLGCVWGAGR
jgi:type IV/VI secretion system ImpK/VasF family protein